MSDISQWKIHGPVHTLRSEFAEWDLSREEWQAPRHVSLVRFLPNGTIGASESHNPDGSFSRSNYSYDAVGRLTEIRFQMNDGPIQQAVYFYDGSGRLIRLAGVEPDGTERESETYSYGQDRKKTKVYFVPELKPGVGFSYGIEGTELSYGADGATRIVTVYDEGGRPGEVLFHDAEDRLLRRVIFRRDGAGRLVSEEMHLAAPIRESEAALANLFGPGNAMSSTTYVYDYKNRLQEQRTRMSVLGEDRTTIVYDDNDNPIEKVLEHTSREVQIDQEGNIEPVKETSHTQNVRFEYRYDEQRNWTERVVWSRLEPNPDFQRSNVERREVVYYAG